MALIPVIEKLQVEELIESKKVKQDMRAYLGMSTLADKCPRKLWYGFRLCAFEYIDARLNRLFGRGHKEEPIIQADLRSIGIIHHSDQLEVIHGNGHIKGHIDDILERIPDAPKTKHLGEYKTHNDKSFKDMIKNGLKKSKPVHYGQMQVYMYKCKLKRGLYIAVNKNDDSRYYERIRIDTTHAKELLKRGEDIISTEVPPAKIGDASYYLCKWCKFYDICQYKGDIYKTCRSCNYCDICDDGVWQCSRYGSLQLAFKQQLKACDRYDLLNTLK